MRAFSRLDYLRVTRLLFKKNGIHGHYDLVRLIVEFAYGFDASSWIMTLKQMPYVFEKPSSPYLKQVYKGVASNNVYWFCAGLAESDRYSNGAHIIAFFHVTRSLSCRIDFNDKTITLLIYGEEIGGIPGGISDLDAKKKIARLMKYSPRFYLNMLAETVEFWSQSWGTEIKIAPS